MLNISSSLLLCSKICGIYELRLPDDKIYIGSSNNIAVRIRTHYNDLINNRHPNKHFQRAFNKHQSIEARVCLICLPEHRLLYEQQFLDIVNPQLNSFLVALRPPSREGIVVLEETKRKLSQKNKGRKLRLRTSEHAAAISIGKKKNPYITSEETKKKLHAASLRAGCRPPSSKGKSLSAEHKKRIGDRNRIIRTGSTQPEETKQKRRATWKRKKLEGTHLQSEEAKQKKRTAWERRKENARIIY